MKRALLLVLACLSSTALADVKIPNTKVSYRVASDPMTDRNASMVFIDAKEDPSGQTYVAVVCDAGLPTFRMYTRDPLAAPYELDFNLPLYYRVDSGPIERVSSWPRKDIKTGRVTVTESQAADSVTMTFALMGAQKQVVIRFNHYTGRQITYTFPTSGFRQAFTAVKNCR